MTEARKLACAAIVVIFSFFELSIMIFYRAQIQGNFGKVERPSMLLPCNDGPYIWDKSGRLDGIGSTLQWRKQSFIAASISNGKWIGDLTNAHHPEEGDQSRYFGLTYPDCDETSLQVHTHLVNFQFIEMPRKNMIHYIPSIVVNKTTVLVFKWGYMEESYNYVVFDAVFRERFHRQRELRPSPKRQINEYWVSIRFRWGDVHTNDFDQPNERSGLGFSDYCKCIYEIQSIKPQAVVFIFAESLTNVYEICNDLNPKKAHHLGDSRSWKRDIDIMSQSNLLIGGSSSFFMLGAHLCQNCTVIHNSVAKFGQSSYENTMMPHMTARFCEKDLDCYLQSLRTYLR